MTFGRHSPPLHARNCMGGVPRHLAHHPPPPPLALAIAWGVCHDVRLPLTTPLRSQSRGRCATMFNRHSPPPRTRNCVGGVPRHSAATHQRRPSHSQSCGGCRTTFGCHSPPPHNCVGGVPWHSAPRPPLALTVARPTPTSGTPHAHKCMGGVFPNAWPHPTLAPSCLQLHGGVYHNALLVHYLDICCSLVVFENIIYEP
jgi:hypothetical protein